MQEQIICAREMMLYVDEAKMIRYHEIASTNKVNMMLTKLFCQVESAVCGAYRHILNRNRFILAH